MSQTLRTSKEIELAIQFYGKQVDELRLTMRNLHAQLESALKRERAAELAARPTDFPKTQKLG